MHVIGLLLGVMAATMVALPIKSRQSIEVRVSSLIPYCYRQLMISTSGLLGTEWWNSK
jgi:hypothetical protein